MKRGWKERCTSHPAMILLQSKPPQPQDMARDVEVVNFKDSVQQISWGEEQARLYYSITLDLIKTMGILYAKRKPSGFQNQCEIDSIDGRDYSPQMVRFAHHVPTLYSLENHMRPSLASLLLLAHTRTSK